MAIAVIKRSMPLGRCVFWVGVCGLFFKKVSYLNCVTLYTMRQNIHTHTHNDYFVDLSIFTEASCLKYILLCDP